MQNLFIIDYEVDTGFYYIRDTALLYAKDETEAVNNLKSFIGRKGNEYGVSQIYRIKKFEECLTGYVFTSKHGFGAL